MTFTLEIDCDNAAFDRCQDEVIRILVTAAGNIPRQPAPGDSGRCRDINGNSVGRWRFGA